MTADRQTDWSQIETWLFDLDNTLYSARDKLFAQMGQKITQYVQDLLDLDYETARQVQKKYYTAYGTTLRGLMAHHDIDPHHYLAFVHDLDASILPIDPNLQPALANLPGRKIIFTNASVPHAENILTHLGILDQFEAIFDIVAADYIPKPDISPYHKLIQTYQVDPHKTAMLEDLSVNLVPAKKLGMTTILIEGGQDRSYQTAQIDGQSLVGENVGQNMTEAHIDQHVENLGAWLQEISRTAI